MRNENKPVRLRPVLTLLFLLAAFNGYTQAVLSPKELKSLPIEDLINVEITLVSRSPEKLSEAASAIQVITNEDIRRSGATNVAEALRLAPNLQVAQLSASVWIISARGFNNVFANKLLVMIDGRTVYTPLYGGVLWEQQNVLLEDVERIEVVSGPGGTLWGANAVNGIINIVTKNTSATQGLYASVAAGTSVKDNAALRYGGKIGSKANFKIYGQHFDRDKTELSNGTKNQDAWRLTQAGFRTDWRPSAKDAFTLQGDYYDGTRKTPVANSPLNGQNILSRWTRTFTENSELALQVYFDRYYRKDAQTASYDKMNTVDADFQHRFGLGKKQSFVWGAGYRYVKDDAFFSNTAGAGIVPRFKRLDLFTAFVQDEFQLTNNLRLAAGTKFLHNEYTGWEWQPSVRMAWVKSRSTLWAAASRAVRTPSRFDVDYYLPMTLQPPNVPSVAGGPNFVSEKLYAYELGYRIQPNLLSSFSVATFYNEYRDVYSVEAKPGTLTYQIQNGSSAKSWGAELSGNYQVHKNWRLRGGYTFFAKEIGPKPGHNFNPEYLGNDVRNQALLQSILNLPKHFQFDVTARYLDGLAKTFATADVPAYWTFDARLAYAYKGFELAVVGQNLAKENHAEFGTINLPRSVYAKISARF
ncbi:TonB-dependent receptor plug domain-containing protein [Flavisolibacter ginsenosidimutans]|uniref:TonB-dependent receptor n=1 Tax=Flavisolibacter ginsenosidimutans TaxID=661481 RepID=A0A5B8UMN6_9BACT|nr:TonB-dependent receptor plug domain-containing protein [Flavisolibacter ginsenosidimutans]QEC57894.1 TonB-dependent receptor [Flavisolibacter ginsenosidimutans]